MTPRPINARPIIQSNIIANTFSQDYDWDYIYELVCDPRLNTFDQIKYSEQIAQLKHELDAI